MRFFACLSRTKRSSSTAAISLPPIYRAAEGSWLKAPESPRIVNATVSPLRNKVKINLDSTPIRLFLSDESSAPVSATGKRQDALSDQRGSVFSSHCANGLSTGQLRMKRALSLAHPLRQLASFAWLCMASRSINHTCPSCHSKLLALKSP